MSAIRLGLVILCAWAGVARAAGPIPEMARKFIKEGLALYGTDKYNDALEAFGRAQVLAPDHEKLFYYIGVCESLLGNCAGAVQHLGEYLRRVPDGNYVVDATGRRDLCLMVMGKKPEPVPPPAPAKPATAVTPAPEVAAPPVVAVARIKMEKAHILDEDEADLMRPALPKPAVEAAVSPVPIVSPSAPPAAPARSRVWWAGVGIAATALVLTVSAIAVAVYLADDPLRDADTTFKVSGIQF